MKASIEHVASIVRIGPLHTDPYSPYTVSLTIRWISPTEVEIMGLDRPIGKEEAAACRELLEGLGITKARWERVSSGVTRWRRKNVKGTS